VLNRTIFFPQAQTCFAYVQGKSPGLRTVATHARVGGEIGQMEQQFCWEVPYNLYALPVGA